MSAEDSCRLISINLSHYVDNPFTKNPEFNFERFMNAVKTGMHMSDNLVELELQHIRKIMDCHGVHDKDKGMA